MSASTFPNAKRPQPLPPVDPLGLVRDVAGLVSPPDICLRIFELMQSPSASARDFAEVVQQDPNLTARLLRFVNSPFYGFVSRIDTVSRAVAVIGTQELYSLVLSVSAVKSFSRIATDLVNMDSFWRHSIFCALLARAVARRCRILHPERLFVAGLLHEVGSLVLFNRLPEVSRDLLLVAEGDEDALYQAELAALGFSHAEVGGLLLDLWYLPATLHGAVRGHHRPGTVSEGRLEASIVRIANHLANRSELGALFEHPQDEGRLEPADWEAVGLEAGAEDEEELVGEAGLQFAETVSFLAVRR